MPFLPGKHKSEVKQEHQEALLLLLPTCLKRAVSALGRHVLDCIRKYNIYLGVQRFENCALGIERVL